jgi:leucyl/phenylalanyl-tRNA--protein transferase
VHLVARLRCGGFRLLDTQFVTKHLARFGVVEIDRQSYQDLLQRAISQPAEFYCEVPESELDALMQSSTQMS